jgi:outer membrane protein OmpA-like peptidoglycan-associated protein
MSVMRKLFSDRAFLETIQNKKTPAHGAKKVGSVNAAAQAELAKRLGVLVGPYKEVATQNGPQVARMQSLMAGVKQRIAAKDFDQAAAMLDELEPLVAQSKTHPAGLDLASGPDEPAQEALQTVGVSAGPAAPSGGPSGPLQGDSASGEPDTALEATSSDLFFAKDSADLTPSDKEKLDAYAEAYVGRKSSESVEVNGYASVEGEPGHNDKLSERRANVVANYLKKKGVTKVAVDWHGGTGSKDELRQNRRVSIKPPLTVRDIVGEVVVEPPIPGKTPNPALGEKADEPDLSKLPIPAPPDEPKDEGPEKSVKVGYDGKKVEFEVAVTFGLRDKKTKAVLFTELQVSAKLSVDKDGNLEPGWEIQLALLQNAWEAKLKNRIGKIEVEATLSVNLEGPLGPAILKKVEPTVQAELKAKRGHIAIGGNVKVGLDGKPVGQVFIEWTF